MGLSVETYQPKVEMPRATKPREEYTPEELQARKAANYITKGFTWQARIVDDEGEVQYVTPQLCKKQSQAHRKGERYLKRFNRNKSFTKPLGLLKPAEAKGPSAT